MRICQHLVFRLLMLFFDPLALNVLDYFTRSLIKSRNLSIVSFVAEGANPSIFDFAVEQYSAVFCTVYSIPSCSFIKSSTMFLLFEYVPFFTMFIISLASFLVELFNEWISGSVNFFSFRSVPEDFPIIFFFPI